MISFIWRPFRTSAQKSDKDSAPPLGPHALGPFPSFCPPSWNTFLSPSTPLPTPHFLSSWLACPSPSLPASFSEQPLKAGGLQACPDPPLLPVHPGPSFLSDLSRAHSCEFHFHVDIPQLMSPAGTSLLRSSCPLPSPLGCVLDKQHPLKHLPLAPISGHGPSVQGVPRAPEPRHPWLSVMPHVSTSQPHWVPLQHNHLHTQTLPPSTLAQLL